MLISLDVYVNVNVTHSKILSSAQVSTDTMATSTFSISELAKEFDLTTRAIRFYEDMGLLRPERSGAAGRNRVYSTGDRTRLRLTLRAKRLGFSLTEAKDIIDMYDSPRDTVPQMQKYVAVLAAHRQQLENQLAELKANLDEVKVHEKEAKALLKRSEAAFTSPVLQA